MRVPTVQRSGDEASPGSAPTLPPGALPPFGVELPQSERLVPVAAPLAGLVIKGTLLSLITLGIYRFWYRTAVRRYYWGNTTLAGDGFEYTGTGKELFVGFLIALAIVLPIYFGVTLLGVFGGEVLGTIVASILGSLIMPALVQVLTFRARRYRLTRTRYRGVRFHQSGSGLGYLFHTIKWSIFSILTLGILLPYLRRALERYKIENTWYGSAQGAFSAPAKPMMMAWMLVWGGAVGILFLFLLIPIGQTVNIPVLVAFGGIFGGISSLLAIIVLPLLWVRYRVLEFRTFLSGTSIGPITLASDLSSGSVIWVWVRYYLILAGIGLSSVLAGWLFGFRPDARMAEDFDAIAHQGPSALLIMIGAFFAIILVTELLFRRRLWALRAASISVTNLSALDQIVQTAGQEATGIGEAFDTGFDIAG